MQPVIFARITKIDESTRTVTGRATDETVDKDGESFHYDSSKPYFQSWSAECFADTNGKSYGNVRSMHGNVAAGKLTDIEFNDAEKCIDVEAKIVDDNEWAKVQAGVFRGFSIGGRYEKKWSEARDGKIIQRYTAVPSEVSLVDSPANPAAKFFSVHKANGTIEKRAFARPTAESLAKAVADGLRLVGALPGGTTAMIKRIHTAGARPLPYDFLHKFEPTGGQTGDAATAAIRKAHRSPRTFHPIGERRVDMEALKKMLARGRRIRKGLPPQSENGTWGGPIAYTGATNDWHDETAPANTSSQLGPRHAASIREGRPPAQDSDIDPTVAALKRIFAAGPKRGW